VKFSIFHQKAKPACKDNPKNYLIPIETKKENRREISKRSKNQLPTEIKLFQIIL
jgi:hypothetical protein